MPVILALETSCDETAAAVMRTPNGLLSSEVASQIASHQTFGGVVPELASRNHTVAVRPVVERALRNADLCLDEIDAFAATAGPGLASSLLVGNTAAKAFAVATGKPFHSVNHLEGHLLSPFIGGTGEVRRSVGLVVSGGHTMLVHLRSVGVYNLLGKTRDDAAGEAFDKVGKMLGLPYPGGPELEKQARHGNPTAYHFPRSMLDHKGFDFSFSGLKTSMRYKLNHVDDIPAASPDLAASFQAAVVDVLVEKTIRAARHCDETLIAVSGGVSCNLSLRTRFHHRCRDEGIDLLIAPQSMTTDNAAMIAFTAGLHLPSHSPTPLEQDINPNLPLK